jgi:hypothetical protein
LILRAGTSVKLSDYPVSSASGLKSILNTLTFEIVVTLLHRDEIFQAEKRGSDFGAMFFSIKVHLMSGANESAKSVSYGLSGNASART